LDASAGIPPAQAMYSFAGAKQGNTTRFFILAADSTDIYVGIRGSDYWDFMRGVYRMDYGSGNWNWCMNGITPSSDWMMFVAMAENDTATVYLAGSTPLAEPNLMKTSTGGASWFHVFLTSMNQNIATGWSGQDGDRGWSYPEYPFGISVARNNANKVIFSGYSGVHKTSDGAANWQQAYLSSTDQHPAGALTPVHQNYHSSGLENTTCWQVFWINQNEMFSCYSDIRDCRSIDDGDS
jgi:hypothetical protein